MDGQLGDVSYRIDEQSLRPIPNSPGEMAHAAQTLIEHARSPLLGDRDVARALGRAGMYLAMLGELTNAELILDEAQARAGAIDGGPQGVVLLLRQGQVYQWQGRYHDADAAFRQVLHACRADAELGLYESYALQHLGKSEYEQGRYGEAAAFFREALQLREPGDDGELISSTRQALAQAELRLAAGQRAQG